MSVRNYCRTLPYMNPCSCENERRGEKKYYRSVCVWGGAVQGEGKSPLLSFEHDLSQVLHLVIDRARGVSWEVSTPPTHP